MRTRTRWWLIGLATFALVAGLVLPATVSRTNCGGNSAALAACKGYITVLRLWEADHKAEGFHLDQADPETKRDLTRLPGASWVRASRLLTRLDGVRLDSMAERRIIMVCDRPYDNVPQRLFGRSPMTHAVAYSTGETGLISSEEFARLDLNGFVDLQVVLHP